MTSDTTRFVGYKQRHCTDIFCLILFIIFIIIYGFISILAISQGNPASLIQASDSFGNICGKNEFKSKPYQLYYDISKCLTGGGLSLVCPTTKLCVSSCPQQYSDYQALQTMELGNILSKNYTRQQLVCMYGFNPVNDHRTIIELVNDGLCAPYTIESEPFLGRCLPSAVINLFEDESQQIFQQNLSVAQINTQMFGIGSMADVSRVVLADLGKIKESLALFSVVACALTLLYMFAVKKLTRIIVTITIILFLLILFICSSFCWYTIYTGRDSVYEYSTVARIVNDFIKLRTIYIVLGSIATFFFIVTLFGILTLFDRIRLSIILLDQSANAVFSVLTTILWSPFIILIYFLVIFTVIYTGMCLSTIGKPVFLSIDHNETVPCIPNLNSTGCIFQEEYGYDSLVLNGTDPITCGVIRFLVDYKSYLIWFNLFAFIWFGTFLFAFEEIVLAGVFSNYYWSQERLTTSFPLLYSAAIIIRYHLGSIALGSLLIATLRFIRIVLDYINEKCSSIQRNMVIEFILKCFTCFLWIFEKFLKFLNKNSYVLIASRGYSFCKATRKAFVYVINNCLRSVVLVHLTEWILFCGIISACGCNAYLFYQYLQWTDEFDQLILRWTPIVAIILITYLIASLFFSVYDMAIKTLFVCFLQDLDENDGSIQHPYVMNNELLRLVHKTNIVEKK
ncbi:unnamed protein product [Rotaria magnacalcarata]|uniref:Choline transporter-like protein n=2 Tax=Rotaria magnacalcarata TaxID=392030 RepID=A0A816FSF7_9BILA|nr:unnamed protein product [Rotaria magnacalcarata]CAF1665533.1 unnamed protein product [Rotaria magnacalcarata]